jgi:O-antigen/teichoic acid export membrane protein
MAFRRNFIFRLAAEVLGKALGLGVTLALARKLGPEAWGGMQWALAGAGFFAVLADFGLGSLVTRELALAPEAERRAWLLAAWRLKGGLWALALLLFAGLELFSHGHRADLLLPAALLTVALSLGDFSGSLYSGFERLDLDFQWGFASKFIQALAALGALALGLGVPGILLSMAGAAWLGWAVNGARLWRLSYAGTLSAVGPKVAALRRGLWPFGLVSVLTVIYVKVDTLLLGHIAGLQAVGVYQSAYKWFEALAFVPAAFIAAAFPSLVRSHHEAEGPAKRWKAYLAMAALGAVATAFLFAWAPLLPRLLGPAYGGAPPLLQALAWGCLVLFPNYVLVNLLIAARQQSRVLIGAALAVAFNIGGNLWLMPQYGALGASWMTAATEAIIFAAAALSLRASLPWARACACLGLASLAAALGCGTAWAVGQQGSLMAQALALLAGPSLSLGLCAWWGLLPLQDLRSLFERALLGRKA